MDVLSVLINYGIAGVVIYLFYTLVSDKLSRLENHITELTREIQNLRVEIEKLRATIRGNPSRI